MAKKLTPRGQAAPPVEPNIAPQKITRKPPKKAKTSATEKTPTPSSLTRYAYNLRGIKARFDLTTGRRVELEPRGQRGDLAPLSLEELEDQGVIDNFGIIFEVISAEQAKEISSKQSTNANPNQPSLIDILTTPEGKPYQQADVHVEVPKEQQGTVVARVEVDEDDNRRLGQDGGIQSVTGPEQVQVPGSPGHPATQEIQQLPSELAAQEVAEFRAWKQAQQATDSAASKMGQA